MSSKHVWHGVLESNFRVDGDPTAIRIGD